MESLRFFLDTGGATAWIIIIIGVILLVATLDRLAFLYFSYSFNSDEALETIRAQVLKREYTSALQVCNLNPEAPQLKVVKAGLIALENGREAIQSSLGAVILEISDKCEKRISLIGLIAAVSTLLGLFGTISGLIKTFAALANADASQKAQLLGSGISEAMYCTAAGLGVGIFAMSIHTLCTTKSDQIVSSSQKTGYKLITWLEEAEKSRPHG